MTENGGQSFDPFGDQYHERLSECLREYGGRDAEYYNLLKVAWLMRLAAKFLGNPSGLKFLDLGCGTGLTEEALCPKFRFGVGVDLSRGMLKARTCKHPNSVFMQADVARLPFADKSFDLVFSVTLMHHLPDDSLRGMFSEIHRVLKPGGITVHFDHNPRNFLTRRIVSKCEYDKDTTLRLKKDIVAAARQNGFKPLDSGYIIFIPAALKVLEPLERLLKPIPLGGQYFMSAVRE